MESLANVASMSTFAQDVQSLRQFFVSNDNVEQDQVKFEEEQLLRQVDRSTQNRMSDEIVSILSDVMATMKKTGEEIRNSGR